MSVRDLFYSKNRDLSKSDRVCGSESCHEQRRLLRTLEKELMLLIRLEKVAKPSLKSLDSTNPQSDRLCKNGGNSIVIVCEVADVPRLTSKQLKAFLPLANVNVMSPPSGEHWATMVCMAELQRRKQLFSKRKLLAKDHVDKPEDYWTKGLMDGWNQNRTYCFKWEAIMFGEKRTHCIQGSRFLFICHIHNHTGYNQ